MLAKRAEKSGAIARGYRPALLLSTALVALACAGDFRAYGQPVTGSGNLTPGAILSPNWVIGGDLTVGDNGIGELTITAGGTVTNATGIIGDGVAGNGTVTVSGVDGSGNASTWTNTGDLFIAYDGAGTLNILAGGQVSNATGAVGSGGTGNALVSGQNSSWANSARLSVGHLW